MKKGNSRKKSGAKFILLLYVTFAVLYLAVSFGLKSANVELKRSNTLLESEITQLKAEVDTLNIQVDKLMEYTRIVEVDNNGTMAYSESSIYVITN